MRCIGREHGFKCDSTRRAAAAEQKKLAVKIEPIARKGLFAADTVRCVAGHFAVFDTHGVDGSEKLRFFVDTVEQGNDVAFVGDGDIKAVERAQCGQRLCKGRYIQHGIFRLIACEGEEAVMDKRRHRVPDGVPDDGKTAKLHFKALL